MYQVELAIKLLVNAFLILAIWKVLLVKYVTMQMALANVEKTHVLLEIYVLKENAKLLGVAKQCKIMEYKTEFPLDLRLNRYRIYGSKKGVI